TALHNYIQSLVKDLGYVSEYRMYYSIPHSWKYLGYDSIVLVGVIDLIHNQRKEIIELKSSTSSDRIEEYHKMQLASYMKMLQILNGERFRGYVIKFGGSDVASEEVSWDVAESYWNTIVQRAHECANILDEEMRKQDSDALKYAGKKDGLYSFEPSDYK
ncbi:MAG: PD-(D/E)XK nuclease family protein, partial [Thermoplasmataceae archaeon]